jgi:hypothetical protein
MPVPAGGSDELFLFTLEELDAWAQTDVSDATGELVRGLVTTAIRGYVGATTYDALTDLTPLKLVALDLARRMVRNADGKRSTSRQIDDYTETDTYAAETLTSVDLTDDDRARIDLALGLTPPAAAFTIRPAGTPDLCGTRRRYW